VAKPEATKIFGGSDIPTTDKQGGFTPMAMKNIRVAKKALYTWPPNSRPT